MAKRVTFMRDKKQPGIASVFQGTRGWYIKVGKDPIGRVFVRVNQDDASPKRASDDEPRWIWRASVGGVESPISVWHNPKTADECKADAKKWILDQYAIQNGDGKGSSGPLTLRQKIYVDDDNAEKLEALRAFCRDLIRNEAHKKLVRKYHIAKWEHGMWLLTPEAAQHAEKLGLI